jgi:hypothetical protein
MMTDAVKLKDQASETERRGQVRAERRQGRAKQTATESAKAAFEGKTFDSLSGADKDELLKSLAIMAGLVEE